MNKKPKNIEQLYSESFEDFRIEPSSGLWKRISSKLAWKTFISFNPATINAYYVAGLLTLATTGALLLTKPAIENNPETQEITINNERPKAEGGNKIKDKSKKIKVKKEEQESNKEINSTLSTEVSSTAEASAKAVTKEDLSTIVITKADLSAVVSTKAETNKSDSGINDLKPVTRNTELVTLNPKPVTPDLQPVTRNSQPVTPNLQPVTLNPEPVTPNTMDSLFFSYNSTPPQHSIEFPNAFTPNTNGPTNGYYTPGIPNNNVFHPEYKGVVEYHLRIFNRRGEQIFESNDINTGWDGYINARLAAQDVYIWKAQGRYSDGQSFVKFGNVMLIKK